MTRAWALYKAPAGAYEPPELLEVFADQAVAEAVRDNLFGRQRSRYLRHGWQDDEDFPDLYVRPVEIR